MSDSVYVAFLYLSVSLLFLPPSLPPPLRAGYPYTWVCAQMELEEVFLGSVSVPGLTGLCLYFLRWQANMKIWWWWWWGGTLPNTVSLCHVLLSFPWALYVTWEYSCWRLESRERKKPEPWFDFSPPIPASHYIFSRFVTGHAVLLVGVKLQFRPDCENKSFCVTECAQASLQL